MKKLLVFVLLPLLIFLGIKFARFFSKSVWDGKNRINLVLIGEKPALFSLNPPQKEGLFFFLPPETFIEVAHGYGQYRIGAIPKLGELEGYGGGRLLGESVENTLEIPIDGFLSTPGFSQDNIKRFLLASFKFSLKKGETNLSKWDLLRLWWQVEKTRREKIISSDWEKITPSLFKDSKIRQENYSLAVLNATSHLGLASKAARLIENIGGRVIKIGETENKEGAVESKKELKESYTVKKLEKIFNYQWREKTGEDFGADIVLVVDENYWKKVGGK